MSNANHTSKLGHGRFEGADGDLTEKELVAVVGGQLPGKRTPPTVTLHRGKNASLELWAG
jgi:hypothetical protein